MTARSFLIEVELGGIQLSVRLQIGSVITVIRQAQMSHWDFLRLAVPRRRIERADHRRSATGRTFVQSARYQPMEERQAARLFGWSLGGLFLVILALNAMAR